MSKFEINTKGKDIDSKEFFEACKMMVNCPVEDTLNFILDSSSPRELIRSFSEERFYLFVNSLEKNEKYLLLSLASNKQWEYFFDVDIWRKDSLDYFSLTELMMLMLGSDPNRFATWFFYENIQLTKIYLLRNIQLKILNNDEDIIDLDENFFTNDGVFYISFVSFNTALDSERIFLENRNEMLRELLLRFAAIDHFRYQSLMIEVAGAIPAELEEELFRLRNIRLSEKGLMPFYEAVGIYQPLQLTNLRKKPEKIFKKYKGNDFLNFFLYLDTESFHGKNLFVNSMASIENNSIFESLLLEFVSLCNLVISADNEKIGDNHDLKKVAFKVTGILNIGIELIFGNFEKYSNLKIQSILKSYSFRDIFRIGHGSLVRLSKKASFWYKKSWFATKGFKLNFWGDYWFGILGGLLLPKPMFFNGLLSESMYREFKTKDEIGKIDKALDQIIAIDNMLSRFNLNISDSDSNLIINVENILLTTWALCCIPFGRQNKISTVVNFSPIPMNLFKEFYNGLWETFDGKHRIKSSKKFEFLSWVSNRTETHPLPKELHHFFEKLFYKLEDDLQGVELDDLDPRYIELFIINPDL